MSSSSERKPLRGFPVSAQVLAFLVCALALTTVIALAVLHWLENSA